MSKVFKKNLALLSHARKSRHMHWLDSGAGTCPSVDVAPRTLESCQCT
jgi:hypothetical protein